MPERIFLTGFLCRPRWQSREAVMAGKKRPAARCAPGLLDVPGDSASLDGLNKVGLGCGLDKSSLVCGLDEAGRGCLAGPVVAAAVILPPNIVIPGLDDSKVVPATRRAGLAAHIGTVAIAWGLGVIWPRTIDEINILEATFKAMSRAISVLKTQPDMLLVDGDKTIPSFWLKRETGREWPQKAIVDGDALIPCISAASIVAKVFRDNLMEKLDSRYPGYGLAHHKGYGTKEHLEALARLGPSPMHRLTFKKVKADPIPTAQGSLL